MALMASLYKVPENCVSSIHFASDSCSYILANLGGDGGRGEGWGRTGKIRRIVLQRLMSKMLRSERFSVRPTPINLGCV